MKRDRTMRGTVLLAVAVILALATTAWPESGNLLKNPGFEEGEAGGTPAGWAAWDRNPSTFVVAEGGSRSSRCAAIRLVPNESCGFVLADQWVRRPIAAGERYRARCDVRAERPVRVTLWLYGGAGGVSLSTRTDVIASRAWRPVSAEFEVPKLSSRAEPYVRFALAADQRDAPTVYLDNAELVRLDADAPVPDSVNLVANGRFEKGEEDAPPRGWVWWQRNPSTFVISSGGRGGGQCAKMRLVKNKTCGFLLADQYIETPLAEGDHLRARAYVRAEKATPVNLYLYAGTQRRGDSAGIEVTGRGNLTADATWKAIVAEADMPALTSGGGTYVRFALGLSHEKVDLYLDDVEVVNVRGGGAAKGGGHDLVFAADRYYSGAGLPLHVEGKPVGASGSVTFKLPVDLDAAAVPYAALWLDVDDIDAPAETGIYVNGEGPARAGGELIGEGAGFSGYVPFDPAFLRPGANEVKFVFEDDLGGATAGFAILDAKLTVVRPGPARPRKRVRSDGKLTEIRMPGIGSIIADNVISDAITIDLPRGEEYGWRDNTIRKGDGRGGWRAHPVQTRMFGATKGKYIMPFGIHEMDNGEIIIGASWNDGEMELPVISFSSDGGETFSNWQTVPNTFDRPMMFTYLGKGDLLFSTRGFHHYSADYGRTWPEKRPVPAAINGSQFWAEGNMLVDIGEDGRAELVIATGGNLGGKAIFQGAFYNFIRWSDDGGKTWRDEKRPKEWIFEVTHNGKTYERSLSEGGLVRADNGDIVAALRTDLPPRYLGQPHNDSLEGTAVCISRDEGKTWSKLRTLYDAGRHHACLVKRPNGDLVMTYVVRVNVREGRFANQRRGMEALVSRDHGETWNLDEVYILDEFKHLDPNQWFNGECGHVAAAALEDGSVLSIYGNYVAKAAVLVRWTPE